MKQINLTSHEQVILDGILKDYIETHPSSVTAYEILRQLREA